MKAKKLLKRVMESRSDKKVAKKIRKRNNKFLAKLYYNQASCPCVDLKDCVTPNKEEYIAWAQHILQHGSSSLNPDDVKDPVKSVSIIAVEFQFWDGVKDPVNVFTTMNEDAIQAIVKSAEVTFSTVDTLVDPEPKQTQQ